MFQRKQKSFFLLLSGQKRKEIENFHKLELYQSGSKENLHKDFRKDLFVQGNLLLDLHSFFFSLSPQGIFLMNIKYPIQAYSYR